MIKRIPETIARQTQERIELIRQELAALDYVCSGTLLKRLKVCGKPNCRCARDPAARHGPYYEWSHLRAGKLLHRVVSPRQALILRQAIANQRRLKKLMRKWEKETERLLDAVDAMKD
jgi:hypothetical protein